MQKDPATPSTRDDSFPGIIVIGDMIKFFTSKTFVRQNLSRPYAFGQWRDYGVFVWNQQGVSFEEQTEWVGDRGVMLDLDAPKVTSVFHLWAEATQIYMVMSEERAIITDASKSLPKSKLMHNEKHLLVGSIVNGLPPFIKVRMKALEDLRQFIEGV